MSDLTCPGCNHQYDSEFRIPRILTFCGHTFCSQCLSFWLRSPNSSFSCPEDGQIFEPLGSSAELDFFPCNFAIINLLRSQKDLANEKASAQVCAKHKKPLDVVCLEDKASICSDCALFGSHKGHSCKRKSDFLADCKEILKKVQASKDRGVNDTEVKINGLRGRIEDRKLELENSISVFVEENIDRLREQEKIMKTQVDERVANLSFSLGKLSDTLDSLKVQEKSFEVLIKKIEFAVEVSNVDELFEHFLEKDIEKEQLVFQKSAEDLQKEIARVHEQRLANLRLRRRLVTLVKPAESSILVEDLENLHTVQESNHSSSKNLISQKKELAKTKIEEEDDNDLFPNQSPSRNLKKFNLLKSREENLISKKLSSRKKSINSESAPSSSSSDGEDEFRASPSPIRNTKVLKNELARSTTSMNRVATSLILSNDNMFASTIFKEKDDFFRKSHGVLQPLSARSFISSTQELSSLVAINQNQFNQAPLKKPSFFHPPSTSYRQSLVIDPKERFQRNSTLPEESIELDLSGRRINDSKLASILGEIAAIKGLKSINFDKNLISEIGFQHILRKLADHPTLESISLSENYLDESIFRILKDGGRKLRSLNKFVLKDNRQIKNISFVRREAAALRKQGLVVETSF